MKKRYFVDNGIRNAIINAMAIAALRSELLVGLLMEGHFNRYGEF
jgi:hypothetical protein